ncbi:MAG TPA: DnaJ domain-containing protein, partial [Catalimonadaceae bacterium]|nr:DnaJ domain-containing protein [Catalimonadaceae bacterium]
MATLYEILGVPPDATDDQIKKAFRKLAKLHHPDHNIGIDPSRFRKIFEAYEVLNDPKKRSAYDHILSAAHKDSEEDGGADFDYIYDESFLENDPDAPSASELSEEWKPTNTEYVNGEGLMLTVASFAGLAGICLGYSALYTLIYYPYNHGEKIIE